MAHFASGDFRWIECGTGEPVVLLHGLMGQAEHWQPTLDALAPFCRATALTLPILDADLPEYSVTGLTEYVRRFLDRQGFDKVVLGGNSLGGHVALELAMAFPERVSALVLSGSSGLFERSFTRGVPHRPNAAWVREKMEEVFYDPTQVTPEWVEAIERALAERRSVLCLIQVARSAKTRNIENLLPELRMPTCLIWGEEDRITPPEVARRFRALIPQSDLFMLSHCGHAPMIERPALFNWTLLYWLQHVRRVQPRPMVVAA
ncbi:MAG TPA: alpha/beta fold hydrolase [Candidatus Methylomirabilis sp.]|nr:alpha/beta fold hydrolase [Candidatus Methylomirabilis sp.]